MNRDNMMEVAYGKNHRITRVYERFYRGPNDILECDAFALRIDIRANPC